MKTVYESATSIESYMILNLLEQEGIKGVVQGEYLQGGAGELQATNLVRVEVPEGQYDSSKKIIQEWESTQVEEKSVQKSEKKKTSGTFIFISGLMIGIGGSYWAYNSGVSHSGIDYDGDSIYDERWIYKNDRIRRTEIDRNRDGKVDSIYDFSIRGSVNYSESDDNFDGVFETKVKYSKGNLALVETDTNNDGKVDYREFYRNGVLSRSEIREEKSNSPIKKQYYKFNKLISSEYDTDGDGIYDKVIEYDYFEEPK